MFKNIFVLICFVCLCACIPVMATEALPATAVIMVDGEAISFDAYNIEGNHYFKLRDLAYTLDQTTKHFSVDWDETQKAIVLTSDQRYYAMGNEMEKGTGTKEMPVKAHPAIIKDGYTIRLTAYLIRDYHYFKLRDIAAAFDFGVDWDSGNKIVVVQTSQPYCLPNIAPYILEEARRVVEVANGQLTPECLIFAAASDFHVMADETQTADNAASTRAAVLDTADALYALQQYTQLDFAAFLGDFTYGPDHYTTDRVKEDIAYVKDAIENNVKDIPQMWLWGNHDLNYGSGRDRRMTEEELYSYIGRDNRSEGQPSYHSSKGYGYIDFQQQKIRAIYLNTSDVLALKEPTTGQDAPATFISPEQFAFLIEALAFRDKTDPSQWGILIFSHYPLSWSTGTGQILEILEAYRDQSSGSFYVQTDGQSNVVSYDFSTVQSAEIIANIHGHTHNFSSSQVSSGESESPWLLRIAVPNVCASRYNESATYSDTYWANQWGDFDKSGHPVYYHKIANTAHSTSFVVFVIDRAAQSIYAIAYGAGIDRGFYYGEE